MSRTPVGCLLALLALPGLARAGQAPAAPAEPASSVRWQVRDTIRAEVWRFFDPQPGGGDPDYAFLANRLYAGLDYRGPRIEATAALQYVQFGVLPTAATGPGALGTGASYYSQAGRRDSRQVYVRYLYLRVKNIGHGVNLQVGRFGYASGAESASGDAKIETVKRQRIDSRLIGEFEWSIYQRAFDGARLDVDRPRWHGTGFLAEPTEGGFEEEAGNRLRRVRVAAASLSLKPSASLRHTDWQAFLYRYDDRRGVTGRPDNTLAAATAADVHVTTAGSSLVGAYPSGPRGQLDVVVWAARQFGRWYGQSHGAGAIALEAGYQRTSSPWRPWLRAGLFRSSGDASASDDRHGTFFQMLPTARRFALSTVYNLMNSTDGFGQVILRPHPRVGIRADVHALRLTRSTDLWYAGSGAVASTGSAFGFAGRRSNGSTALGTMTEGALDWTLSPHLTVAGYLGRMTGGAVVTGTFAGSRLGFGYVEAVVAY